MVIYWNKQQQQQQ